jgi:chromosomal replication initiation ATPase DnaA
MNTRKKIEKAVCEYYKVEVKDLYSLHNRKYPYDGARNVLMYLLYKNKMKSYELAVEFDMSDRMVFKRLAEVSVALKSDTKLKEDIETIEKCLTYKK